MSTNIHSVDVPIKNVLLKVIALKWEESHAHIVRRLVLNVPMICLVNQQYVHPPYTILGILKALSRNQRSLLRTQINLEIMRGTHLDTSLF